MIMNHINVESYEVKSSKTDYKVPVVNEVHLHSVYNPIKEASSLIEKHKKLLEAKPEVLIFGLGFGYHVQEAISVLRDIYNDDFKIIIIEPNQDVVNDCLDIHNFDPKNVIIYSGEEIESLYADVNLVSFLINKPAVIPHPASFNLYSEYFKSFLTHKALKSTSSICSHIQAEVLRDYINDKGDNLDINEMINNKIESKQAIDNNLDFLMLAYKHMTNEHSKTSQSGTL
jgi:hypothetical protein